MKLLIDLSILRHPYCGLGQIALNYGRWLAGHAHEIPSGIDITLLVPKPYIGAFGPYVGYLQARPIYRHLPWLLPRFDLWHSIHQLSPFRPANRRTRRIVTIHDLNFLYEKHGRKRLRYLHRLQAECDRADTLCFISQFARQQALQHLRLGTTPLHTIYNGVQDLTTGPQRPPLGIDPARPFLLSIGVIKPKKNIHTLFPLMTLLPGYDLIVAGNDTDPYARDLRSQLPSHPNIRFTGIVDDDQRRWLYAHCTALLMPSLSEGFGLPVIEAMQWGKPVFASTHTSLPEIGGTHAFYFTDFQPAHMAGTLLQGLAAYTPAKAQDAKTHAATFNYDTHMTRYCNLYQTIAQAAADCRSAKTKKIRKK